MRFLTFLLFVFLSLPFSEALSGQFSCVGAKGGKPGACAHDFVLNDLDGRKTSLSDYAGKVIFLNFWATWCSPCAVEIPWMETLNHKLLKKKFAMITVSIDTDGGAKKIFDYYQSQFGRKPAFPVLLDQTKAVSNKYGTFKVPETYIIDHTGKILDKVEGIKDWTDSMILHYLELLEKAAR